MVYVNIYIYVCVYVRVIIVGRGERKKIIIRFFIRPVLTGTVKITLLLLS